MPPRPGREIAGNILANPVELAYVWRTMTSSPSSEAEPAGPPPIDRPKGGRAVDGAVYGIVALAGVVFWWWSVNDPTTLPVWAPWDFAPLQFLCFWLAPWWYARGLRMTPAADRPPIWRTVCFGFGLVLTYAVLMTRFEYLAEHMFFLNRIQHVVMHHLGPLLIALGWPGAALLRGMPQPLARAVQSRWVVRPVHWIQQPAVATVLFVGLIYLWLVPSIHFQAMISPRLYALMNWTMVVDGILFWSLILDPRPYPKARTTFLVRCALVVGAMFPQILVGAFVTFSNHDLYDFYHWCGRIFPTVDAMRDQMIGGLVVWIPGAMMSVIGLLLVLNFMRQEEEENLRRNPNAAYPKFDASLWTGR